MGRPRVLFCVLNWGIGHATRSIPVIKALQQLGVDLYVASDGPALRLLEQECSAVRFFSMPSYNIKYPAGQKVSSAKFAFQLAKQSRKVSKVIAQEHQWTQEIVDQESIDAIVSDNRYGCYSNHVPSALICHQHTLPSPFLKRWVNKRHRRLLKKFTDLWIPNDLGPLDLAGNLAKTQLSSDLLGLLSRFSLPDSPRIIKNQVTILCSGPEPQRSIFKRKMLQTIKTMQDKKPDSTVFYLLSGDPEKLGMGTKQSSHLHILPHMSTLELQKLLLESKTVISRSGYSTLMDLEALGCNAILVPTPGQPEQLYLAEHMTSLQRHAFCPQHRISADYLFKALSPQLPAQNTYKNNRLHSVLDNWISQLK